VKKFENFDDTEALFFSDLRKRMICSSLFRLPVFFLLFFFSSTLLHSQNDSILYSPDFKFREGIYLTFADFRSNKPIPKTSIVSDFDKSELNFLRKELTQRTINYTDSSGKLQAINPGKLWGFSENNSVYIHFNADFNKIVVIGSFCHFTSTYTSYMTTGPTTGGESTGTPVENMQQYVLDMKTGIVSDFILPNMEILFQRDAEIYKEFMALRKGKRRQLMFFYLRKYNEKHPLYFMT
jgi:hypothetical protein